MGSADSPPLQTTESEPRFADPAATARRPRNRRILQAVAAATYALDGMILPLSATGRLGDRSPAGPQVAASVADRDWSAFSPDMKVTSSGSVATHRPNEGPDTFLARADSARYSAKAQGCHRIASA